jgi:hypothetical protein
MLAKAPPPERHTGLKPEIIRTGDVVYCRSKRYREQLQLPAETGLVIEIKRNNFKILYASDKRAWVPREALVGMKADSLASDFLARLHFLLRRVDAHECELISADGINRVSARIDKIDAATVDDLRAFLGEHYLSLTVVPEGMAFMQLEITFSS